MSTPNALLDLQAQVAAQLAMAKETVLAPTTKRITIKNGKLLLPDGTASPNGSADIIILTWRWMNRYFPNAYNPNNLTGAACWAVSNKPTGLEPGGENPVHSDCDSCPKNQFGSAPNGGKGKACRNQAVLACVAGDGQGELFTVTLAPTSIQGFSRHIMKLAGAKIIPAQVITKLSMDTSVTYPKYSFEATTTIGETDLLGILERQQEANEYMDAMSVRMHIEAE